MNKTMKRFTLLILLVCLLMLLAACHIASDVGGVKNTAAETTDSKDPVTDGVTARPSLDNNTETGPDSGNETLPQQQETKPPVTDPTTDGTVPEETTPADMTLSMNYQQYMNLTGSQQQALYDKYFADDPLAFAAWFQKIKAEYEDEIPEIIATGPVDIGDYINP